MILYFSGTGNSEYVAKRIGRMIGDEAVDLFEKIREKNHDTMYCEREWVVVVPTYAWRIPRIVQKWLENTRFTGRKELYFVMTCGGSIGNAGKYTKKLSDKMKMDYRGCIGITMPENYIALFSTPEKEEALAIIERAEGTIDRVSKLIQSGRSLPEGTVSVADKLSSGIVNDFFYPMCVHAKKFYATDACISCGKCVKVCPLYNVRLENGKPVWGNNCTHCMACICRCPSEAIEYGKHSKGMPRYTCPKKV